ncbi:MAG: flagellar hook-length control protein FliK [Devosia sp.]|uniref:flagellar hook-length control protein FliK n=1 Tax=unclassified Devosia TaxID=196773 RepID=UPI0019FA3518|nr:MULTISPECIES: flagellar hook-length control protein FliK [unclassified Devosia]MBF0678867.1 flagellar hook-length control protein FliK [Devosia sp.]WEJ32767.1 flagellar hook-length control protein FliK [Devosia sp. SD17-2]
MASHLTLLSAFGAAPVKPVAPVANKADARDDAFARLVEPEAKPADNKPADTAAAPAKTADRDAPPPKNDAVSGEPATVAEAVPGEADDAAETETPLSEALLEALAAVVSTLGGQAEGSPLKDIEDALGELADAMGIDMASLIQQLQKLAEANGAVAGGQGDADGELLAKLTDFLAKALGTDAETLDPEIQANLSRLVDAAKKFAQMVPTEPELAEPTLKLSEPVLTGKAEDGAATDGKSKDAVSDKEPGQRAAPEAALRAERPAGADAGRPAPNPAANGADGAELNLVQQSPTDVAKLPTDTSAAVPRVVQAGYQTSQQQINLPQIAFEMARQVDGGNTRFQIRLDPPELGRIDVKLDIDANGQVNARLTVEKAETLDLMQRDQRALERALQQAGLDASKTNLEFSLKQNPFAGDQNDHPEREGGVADQGEAGTEDSEAPPAVTLYRGALQASGLNIVA